MRPRLHLLVHLVTGGLVGLVGMVLGAWPEYAAHWLPLREPMLAAGMILALLGVFYRLPKFARLTAGLCVSVLALLLILAAAEVGFRWLRLDFRGQEAALRRIPPFYRKPMVPTGTVFFRRNGPDQWTGEVVKTYLRELHLPADAYRDEPTITVRYDAYGFRNENRTPEWDLAVAGDSFTELGHLPFDQLFTTLVGKLLHWRVLNLGVSHTGPLTQLSYLEDYGLSPATKQVVLVFYEGNDLEDLMEEETALLRFQNKGIRYTRQLRPQTSLLRALGELVHRETVTGETTSPVDAYFLSPRGPVPVTLGPTPKGRAHLPEELQWAVADFLKRYAEFARSRGLRAWLAYMPCKQRVIGSRLRWAESVNESALGPPAPTDLPEVLAEGCAQRGLEFFDLTPALVAEVERSGALPYATLYDGHLNARGSFVVAHAMARRLAPADAHAP